MKKFRRTASRLLLACTWIAAFSLPIAAQEEPPTPDDIAAIWQPSDRVLYTLPEDQDSVLATLGAQPAGEAGGDLWTAQTQTLDGAKVGVTFSVQHASLNQLHAIFFNPGDPVPCPHPDYVIYKNSICAPVLIFSYLCQPSGTGSARRTDYPGRACRRSQGAGYCVDVRSVTGRVDFYDLANCSGPVRYSHPLFGWRCHQ